jgi:hypothetical protein
VYWVYKCNSRNHPYQVAYGDWNDFFVEGRTSRWGSTEWVKAFGRCAPGDTVLAYQTDRNELVGVVKVVELRPRRQYRDLIIKPLKLIGVKVRPLKELDAKIAAIPAFQSGPIQTLYSIDYSDARRLLRTAGLQIKLERQTLKSETVSILKRGGGFGSPTENKITEDAAVKYVKKHFQQRGWQVRDVSSEKCGYDLFCSRRKSAVHVEVKGVAGSLRRFIITAAERRQWEIDKSFVLAIVTSARSAKPSLDIFRGSDSIKRFYFEPLSFMVSG